MKKVIIISCLTNIVLFFISNLFFPKQKIMVADFGILRETVVAKTITTLNKKDSDQEEEQKIEAELLHFQEVLAQLAKKKNALILDKNAVIGGLHQDITRDLQDLISDL